MPAQSYNFEYPDHKSYTQLPHTSLGTGGYYDPRTLRHGYIFGYKDMSSIPSTTGFSEEIASQIRASAKRRIDFDNSKVFQFNPPALNITAAMVNTDSQEAQIPGGNNPHTGVGYATSSLELIYDRTQEVAKANNNRGNEKWRDLGVQVDIFELLTVISGGVASKLGGYTGEPTDISSPYPGPVKPGSLNHLTGTMLDAAVTGSNIMMNSFAIVFNANLAVHVLRMTGFGFTYLNFTKDLVPTQVKIEMGLEITNMGTMTHVTSGGAAGAFTGDVNSAPPPGVSGPTSMSNPFGDISRALGV